MKYSEIPQAAQDLCELASEVVEKAESWITAVNKVYRTLEIHTMKASKDITIEITEFSPDGSQTVFEFLLDFERKYRARGTESQKADVLWRQHLSQKLKNELDHVKTDLGMMKKKLIEKKV